MRHFYEERFRERGRFSIDKLGDFSALYRIPSVVSVAYQIQLRGEKTELPQEHGKNGTNTNSLLPRTFVQKYTHPPNPCATDPNCIDIGKIPIFKNIRTGLIDPDTPQSAMTKTSADGKTLTLVVRAEDTVDSVLVYMTESVRSSRTSLTKMAGRSIPTMIHTLKPSTFGTV